MKIENSLIYSEKVATLKNATDFSDYIKLLKSSMPIMRYLNNLDLKEHYRGVYFAFFEFVNSPSAFDSQLEEVDQLHMNFYSERKIYANFYTEFYNIQDFL